VDPRYTINTRNSKRECAARQKEKANTKFKMGGRGNSTDGTKGIWEQLRGKSAKAGKQVWSLHFLRTSKSAAKV